MGISTFVALKTFSVTRGEFNFSKTVAQVCSLQSGSHVQYRQIATV